MKKPAAGRILMVLAFAVALRTGVVWLTPGALESDPDGYRRLAENLMIHGTLGTGDAPTAYRPPLYPLLIAGVGGSRAGLAALHVAMGAAAVGLTLLLAGWWGLSTFGAAVAALLVACDPILLNQSTQVMTETPAVFLAIAGLAALAWFDRRPTPCRAVLCGAVLGLGALCRPAFLPWAALIVAAMLWKHRRQCISALGFSAAFGSGLIVVLCPWAVRNQVQFGRPIATTTHGGYTLLLANNPEFYEWLRSGDWGGVWRADRFNAAWDRRRPADELQSDRLAYREAWQTIGERPGTFAYACLVRVGRLWSPLPHRLSDDESPRRRAARWCAALWYAAEFFLVGICVLQSFRPPPSALRLLSSVWLWGLLLAASLTAVHALYWTDMRMRGPAMPVVALAAAAALSGIVPSGFGFRPRPAWPDRDRRP